MGSNLAEVLVITFVRLIFLNYIDLLILKLTSSAISSVFNYLALP